MEYLTVEEQLKIQAKINSQEGQAYPCSNQVVLCGFFGSSKQWEKFVRQNKSEFALYRRGFFTLNSGESWKFFDTHSRSLMMNTRGYRFYKLKVSPDVYKEVFFECIYPYCALYCKELEWI